MSGRASKSDGKGAAEEVEVEPERAGPPSSATSYDPTVFQRPHPADRGGGDGKPRKGGGGKAKAKGESSDKAKAKSMGTGKKGFLSLDRCGWCDTEGANKTCTQCRSVVYCSPACQKVSRT